MISDATESLHTIALFTPHCADCAAATRRRIPRAMKAQAELVLGRLCHVAGARRPRPSLFVYPGLTAKPWHDASTAPFASWLPALEAATPAIRDEYLAVRAENLPSDYDVDEGDHASGLHRGGDWHWASFIARGERREPMWERCPQTAAALAGVPGLMEGMPFAFAFFDAATRCAHRRAHVAAICASASTCRRRAAGR